MKRLLSNALQCLFYALLFSPLPLLFGSVLAGCEQLAAGIYYFAGQLLSLIISLLPGRRRIVWALAGAAAYIAAGLFTLNALNNTFYLFIIALCAALFFVTLRTYTLITRYDTRFMIAGVIMHAIMPVIIQLTGIDVDYTAMMYCGIAFLLMCPLILNDSSVREGMSLRGRGGKPIRRISNKNRALVCGLTVIALAIANIDRIREAAQRAGAWLWHWILRIIEWITSLFAQETPTGGESGGGMGDMGMIAEESEPNWLAELLEQVFKYVALVIAAVLVLFLLWKIIKVLIKLAKRISAWMRRYAQGVMEDYAEEREQLVDWGDVGSEMLSSVKDALKRITTREKRWNELDARDRVRYVVRQLYRKNGIAVGGIEYMSARQALSEMGVKGQSGEELAQLYDEARYSNHEITEAQAEQARMEIR